MAQPLPTAGLGDTNIGQVREYCTNRSDTYPAIDPTKADLTGKSAVITGASKGIGRATAIAYAQAGCSKIAVCARSDLATLADEIKNAATAAGHAEPYVVSGKVDVSSEEDFSEFAKTVGDAFGSVDFLVNNAGYLEEWLPLAESRPSEWWKTWEINIKGTYLAAHFFIPLVVKSQGKTVINVSSNGAHGISRGASGYQGTKFAVCRLTEFMGADYAAEGLIAIALHPGGIATDLAVKMPKAMHAVFRDTVELSAHFMVWLSRERRDWLQGRFVSANWDATELEAKKDEIVSGNKLKFRMVL